MHDDDSNYPIGMCAECDKPRDYEYRNIGREQWAFCTEHKRKWQFGDNLFSSWRYETEDDWWRNVEFLKDYRV